MHIPQEVHVILHLIIKANIYLVLNERCVHQCKRTWEIMSSFYIKIYLSFSFEENLSNIMYEKPKNCASFSFLISNTAYKFNLWLQCFFTHPHLCTSTCLESDFKNHGFVLTCSLIKDRRIIQCITMWKPTLYWKSKVCNVRTCTKCLTVWFTTR